MSSSALPVRVAPGYLSKKPILLNEVHTIGETLGMDLGFEPMYSWIAEELICSDLPGVCRLEIFRLACLGHTVLTGLGEVL